MSGLINFLNPKFKPTVESIASCEEGFTAANLIAENAEQLNRGFKSLPTCKPPVEIIFNFPKAVDMKVIKLWPSLRVMRSVTFELHGRENDNWERVGLFKNQGHIPDAVTFCHQSEYNSQSSSNAATAASFAWQPPSEKAFFFKTGQRILASTNIIKLTIRCADDCPAVLRKAEMWGLPSRSLEKADKELMTSMWSEISDSQGQQGPSLAGPSLLSSPLPSPPRAVFQLREQSTLSVPEEFLDCITWEIMMIPTVLPSGKVVDESTIKKHAAAEAKWGRQPSDPFTSLQFNEERKTKVNLELKKRIEDYLMEHPGEFEEVKDQPSTSSYGFNRFGPYVMGPVGTGFTTISSGPYGMMNGVGPLVMGSVRPSMDTFTGNGFKRRMPGFSPSASFSSAPFSSSPPSKRMKYDHPAGTMACCGGGGASSTSSLSVQQQQHSFGCTGTPMIRCISCRSNQYRYKIRTCGHYVCIYCLVQLQREHKCVCKIAFQDNDVEQYYRNR